jgi:hypothetical protein
MSACKILCTFYFVCIGKCYLKIRRPLIILRSLVYYAHFVGSIKQKAFGMLCDSRQEPFGLVLPFSVETFSSQTLITALTDV